MVQHSAGAADSPTVDPEPEKALVCTLHIREHITSVLPDVSARHSILNVEH